MGAASQLPLINRILALEPMTLGDKHYSKVDDILADVDADQITIEEAVVALRLNGFTVSLSTLRRWAE